MRSPRIKPYKGLNTFDDVFDFVPVEACAKAMDTTPEQVIKLVKSGALSLDPRMGVAVGSAER